MSKIYCGIGEVPKKSKRGSMEECVKLKQVRYYGLKKVDPRLINYGIEIQKGKATRAELSKKKAGLSGKIKKYMKMIIKEKKNNNEKKKKELIVVAKKMVEKLAVIEKKIKKIQDKEKKSSTKKSSTKKPSTKKSEKKKK
jgi:hypothetical protein